MYNEGLSDSDKAAIAVSTGQFDNGWNLSRDMVEAILADVNEYRSQNSNLVPLMTQDELRSSSYISYTNANQNYSDFFGGTLPKENVNGGCTRSYRYIASADIFIDTITYSGVGGCGGAGFPGFAVRKGDYKSKGNEIHIDVSTLTSLVSENDYEICDVYSGYPDIRRDGETLKFSQEKIDSYANNSYYCGFPDGYLASHDSLFDNATSYRFTFKKNSDGIYNFSKVEKL